jgi:undecaprenyl-diphosphatase
VSSHFPPIDAALAPSPRWARLDAVELRVVRRFSALARLRLVRAGATLVNVLADGWMYPPIAAGVYALAHSDPWKVLAQALVAVLLAHLVHAVLKRALRRPRPYVRDPSLVQRARALDRWSFPSGHCMTLMCVAVPIVHGVPWLWVVACTYVGVLGAARLVAGHHYPSDVLAGITLGWSAGWLSAAVILP